jgi:dienelactone hydrolase
VSEATFVADDNGTVDLERDAPLAGSYEGVEPMGLLWSMQPEPGDDRSFNALGPLPIQVSAEADGQAPVSVDVERVIVADGITRTRVRERGLVATCFEPAGDGPHPAVLVFSGSGGGMGSAFWQAAVLAGHGFATMALAYFALESLPPRLSSIPLEYFETALDWLAERSSVGGRRIGVIGTSRGGELSLLLGATYPAKAGAIVAYVPSHIVWGGFGPPTDGPRPSWTLGGEPLPFLRRRLPGMPPEPEPSPDEPFALTPGFLRALENREGEERAAIPVERIDCPVLMISGREDAMWPSTLMAERAAARLAAHHHPHRVEHLAYAGAGHSFFLPHLPIATSGVHPIEKKLYDYGGNPRDCAHARADSWPRLVAFLAESLRPARQISS